MSIPGPVADRFFPPEVIVAVKAIACELPATLGMPLSRLHVPDVRDAVLSQGLVADISGATIWRWLSEDAIKPWTHRSWIFPRDPDFEAKAGRVLDLYHRQWSGKPLTDDEYVISADEKTSIQARIRLHPTSPPGLRLPARIEHGYQRGGALAYLAAWDVHGARLFGRCEPTTGIAPFARLVQDVMTTEPYASARRVYWVVDNGSSHRGQPSTLRMKQAWPTARLVHLPIHSSWLNQIEIYFSILQRKVLTPNDFTDLAHLKARIHAFAHLYQNTATPFEWRFTRRDLTDLLGRLADKTPAAA
jgi:hypothetical protein